MTSKVIMFGAGASFGSDNQFTPPLGAALFAALRQYNPPGWGQVPPELAASFERDFEVGMTQLADMHPHWMPILQRAMAAYFFNFVPQSSNQYIKLSKRIQASDWKGALATLNYERLLELSLLRSGIQPVVSQVPLSKSQIELCLPHGCCHIFCEGARGMASGVSFSGVGVTTDGPITVIGEPGQFSQRITNDAFPPVMSYFEPQKTTTAGASFIRSQRQRWQELVLNATMVGVIGVRVRPSDEHIWGALARTKAKIVYCAGKQGGKEFENWRARVRAGSNDMILPGYFSGSFEKICSEMQIA